MAYTPIVEADLLTDISQVELSVRATALLQTGQTDPITSCIADSLGIIKMYADPYLLNEDVLTRIWKLLTISGLYNRLDVMPDKRQKERDWCMKTLEEIRDGKFPNLLIDAEVEATLGASGSWGSATRVNMTGRTS